LRGDNVLFEFFVVTSWHVKIPSSLETIYSLYPLLKVVSGISIHPVLTKIIMEYMIEGERL